MGAWGGFCVSGASGTGKTTVARAVAPLVGATYHDGSFGRIARSLGYDAVGDMSLGDRMTMQERCLARWEEEIARVPRPFVTDRCPLDMVGYVLAEVTMHSGEAHSGRIADYVGACLEAARRTTDAVAIVRPLDSYEAKEGRPPASRAYQLAVQLLVEGAWGRVSGDLPGRVVATSDRGERIAATAAWFRGRLAGGRTA